MHCVPNLVLPIEVGAKAKSGDVGKILDLLTAHQKFLVFFSLYAFLVPKPRNLDRHYPSLSITVRRRPCPSCQGWLSNSEDAQGYRGVIWELGLQFNSDKLSCVYGPHSPSMKESMHGLPGEDLSQTGMRILGRLFCGDRIREDYQDMRAKQMRSWNQYHCYKGLFRSHATVKKRLLIMQTCILSVQLWLAETWKPTERLLSSLRGFHYALMRAAIPLPTERVREGEHRNISHARWALKQLHAHGFALADALDLLRYFRWAGHIARSRHRHVGEA